jgi:hypothetical protein
MSSCEVALLDTRQRHASKRIRGSAAGARAPGRPSAPHRPAHHPETVRRNGNTRWTKRQTIAGPHLAPPLGLTRKPAVPTCTHDVPTRATWRRAGTVRESGCPPCEQPLSLPRVYGQTRPARGSSASRACAAGRRDRDGFGALGDRTDAAPRALRACRPPGQAAGACPPWRGHNAGNTATRAALLTGILRMGRYSG